MNCADFEQLLDAYLDGELSGSLRLEFDAHRLRCRSCELTVASMEAVEDVITADRPVPFLDADFTNRVMANIEARKPRAVRSRGLRIAIVGGAVLQAAAVLLLALSLPAQTPKARVQAPPAVTSVSLPDPGLAEQFRAIEGQPNSHEQLVALITERVEKFAAVPARFNSDFARLADYGRVSEDFAQATEGLRDVNPVQLLLEALAPSTFDDHKPADASTGGKISL